MMSNNLAAAEPTSSGVPAWARRGLGSVVMVAPQFQRTPFSEKRLDSCPTHGALLTYAWDKDR